MKRSCNAASEVFSFIIVLLITSGLITSLTIWGIPYMEEKKASARLDAALLQFDALDNIIEDCVSQYVGNESGRAITSSKTMNFVMESGEISFENNTERIVIYTSLYDWYSAGETEREAFLFDVWDFEPDRFNIYITQHKEYHGPGIELTCDFILKEISGEVIERVPDKKLDPPNFEVKFNNNGKEPLSEAVKIEIYLGRDNPKDLVGIIFIFDVNSIIYEDSNQNGIYRAIVQNGAVISSRPMSNAYFFNEPSQWQTTMLDGSKLFNFRIIDVEENPDYNITSVSGSASTELKFNIESNLSIVDSDLLKIPFFNFLKIKFYGTEKVTDAWRFFYKFNYNFSDYKNVLVPSDTEPAINYTTENPGEFFSINYAKCTFGMEVV